MLPTIILIDPSHRPRIPLPIVHPPTIQPLPQNKFDLVWSMESGEHMPDKPTFVNELIRVAAPGGRIIIVTWCHRDLEAGESAGRRAGAGAGAGMG